MIIEISDKADLLNDYSQWVFSRLYNGRVSVKSAKKHFSRQNDVVTFSPDAIPLVVFKTRKPSVLCENISNVIAKGYNCLCEVYLSPYSTIAGKVVEPMYENKQNEVAAFKRLAKRVGKERVVWHYSPVFVSNEGVDIDFHLKCFRKMCKALYGSFSTVVIDFWKPNHNYDLPIMELSSKDEVKLTKYALRLAWKNDFNIVFNYNTTPERECDKLDFWSGLIDVNLRNQEILDLGIEGACTGGCLYCEYRNLLTSRNIKVNHKPDNISLMGDSPFWDKSRIRRGKENNQISM